MASDKMPSHYEIMSYWKYKNITDAYEVENCSEFCSNIICDPDVPVCFACGEIILPGDYINELIDSVWDNKANQNKTDEEKSELALKKVWNVPHVKHKLQKCHIRPKALGGDNTVSNLFLMCSCCHHDAPDTVYSKSFFRFIKNRRAEGSIYLRAYKEAKAVCGDKLDEFIASFNDLNDMWKIMFDEINTHGFNYNQSSMSSWLIEKCEVL